MGGELDRLRRQGEARLAAAEQEKREASERQASQRREHDRDEVRLAVGRYRYRAARTALFYAGALGLPVFAVAIVLVAFDVAPDVTLFVVMGSLGWLFGALFVWDSKLWRASRGAMREERRYLAGQPFAVHGYFEWLVRWSSRGVSMRLELRGPGLTARRDDLRTLIAAVHPNVVLDGEGHSRDAAQFLLGDIPSASDDQRVRVVHELFDRVLVPLARETSIESVRILD